MTAQIVAKRPTIKILLYTDDPNAISQGRNLLGLSSMIDRLKAHAPAFADLSLKWVSRSSDMDHHADNKLDLVLTKEHEETGEPFDEIWFFGLHQANTDRFSLGVYRGGPESELDGREIDALEKWMRIENGSGGGGVLMTGDHNNPVPRNRLRNANGSCPDPVEEPQLLGLGRALGRCVPRAGALRKWDGPPSSRSEDSLNTLASTDYQTDRIPQELIHQRVNDAGEPDPQGQVHPLFFYQHRSLIDYFPDHRHEGALVIPDLSNREVWPAGPNGQPKPCVVAFGTDRRTGNRVNLVTAYDGDRAGVGRIVADSSWHHYVNINLKGFPHPAPANSPSDKIGQFYGNLALWLAPRHKRRQMAQAMYLELADYTQLLEPEDDTLRTGEIAYSLLERVASPCEIHELLRAHEVPQAARFSEGKISANSVGGKKLALGAVVSAYHQARIRAEETKEAFNPDDVVSPGFVTESTGPHNSSANGNHANNGTGVTDPGNTEVAHTDERQEWTIDVSRESKPNEAPLEATLVFKLNDENGIVTGEVSDTEGRFISTVTGVHQQLPGAEPWFMGLDFKWGGTDVMLSGVTFQTSATVYFHGRFRAIASTAVASVGTARKFDSAPELAPGEGDTGTATGQQT